MELQNPRLQWSECQHLLHLLATPRQIYADGRREDHRLLVLLVLLRLAW
jgi:hypothetical protein